MPGGSTVVNGGQPGMEAVLKILRHQDETLHDIISTLNDLRSTVQEGNGMLQHRLGLGTMLNSSPLPQAVPDCGGSEEGSMTDAAASSLGELMASKEPCPKEPEPADIHELIAKTAKRQTLLLRQNRASRRIFTDMFFPTYAENVDRIHLREAAEKKGMTVPEYLVSHPIFDTVMCGLIILNFVVIFVQLEWKGYDISYRLGESPTDGGWHRAQPTFQVMEKAFNALYLFELILRLIFTRRTLLADVGNLCDGLIIVACCVESFILDPLITQGASNSAARIGSLLRVIRILRALRLLRFVRILRMMGMFSALRVLLKTLSKSMQSLVWSMLVLGCIVLACALLIMQLTVDYMTDEAEPVALRREVSYYFGSAMKASFTMFEATFTAKWATHFSRPLIESISPWFSVFWIIFTVTINFAVVRVIAALFLKQTMDVASVDAERMALLQMQERESIMTTLREIFQLGDQTKDGLLHKWEFEQMMTNEHVLEMFEELELETPELFLLFDLLAEDDHFVDQEEFLTGAMKLKSNVRIVDMIQVLHAQRVSRRHMQDLAKGLEAVDRALHPVAPWKASRCSVLASDD